MMPFLLLFLLSCVSSQDQEPPKIIEQYKILSSQEIHETVHGWATHYKDFVRVTTSQSKYGLPAAGTSADCPYDTDQDGCVNLILQIQDYVANPEDSESSKRLPEVLWSGALHGDERVGPTAVLEAAQLLIDAAACESLPRRALKDTDDWEHEVANAKACRQKFADRGILDYQRRWLARLVSTRRIIVVPTANALGYYRNEREEDGIDPNRDFPFDLQDPKICMQTIAGRTFNEIFQEHMFQLSLTFHGGMEVIGYEWGAPTWSKKTSPDDIAQDEIAAAYSFYGGGWAGSEPYNYGNMNDLVYPVRGGMEDWAYAGSWDTERVIQCKPDTFGGYSDEKTVYGPSTLRVFNMLVESSNHKTPRTEDLGTSQDVLEHATKGNGYVSRNIRLSLLAADMVEPYLSIRQVNELQLTDDVVPLQHDCPEQLVSVPRDSRKVVLQWMVGGAITVDNTQVWYCKWDDSPKMDCGGQPRLEDVKQSMQQGTMISAFTGKGKFAKDPSGLFAASIDISGYSKDDKLMVIAMARVDQNWAASPDEDLAPNVPPQSHIVNARTNATWHHVSAGKVIQGRLEWFSRPLAIRLDEREQTDSDADVLAIELSDRLNNNTDAIQIANRESNDPPKLSQRMTYSLLLALGFACVFLAGREYMRHRMRVSARERVRDFIEDESAISPGLRHKTNGGYEDDEEEDHDDDESSVDGVELGNIRTE
jgi:hypothetical protein